MMMESWVTSLSYAAAATVSDNCGQLFMTDDTGMLAGAQPVVKDIRQAWLPASLITWITKGPSRPATSTGGFIIGRGIKRRCEEGNEYTRRASAPECMSRDAKPGQASCNARRRTNMNCDVSPAGSLGPEPRHGEGHAASMPAGFSQCMLLHLAFSQSSTCCAPCRVVVSPPTCGRPAFLLVAACSSRTE